MPKKPAKQQKEKTREERQEELQAKYLQLQLLKQQLNELAETRNSIIERAGELATSIDALQKLDKVVKGDEIWSSIGSSAFVRSDIKDTQHVLVGIGAGVVIKETGEKAVKIMEGRLQDLKNLERELLEEVAKFARAIELLEPQVEALAHEQAQG
jgi:prefoldin alpha subunit